MPRHSALILLSLLLLSREARSDPALHVSIAGRCPDIETLRLNVDPKIIFQQDATRWFLEIEARRGRSTLTIRDAESGSNLQREVRSNDCEAIAKAFAVIIHGYFVELQVLPSPLAESPVPPQDIVPSGGTDEVSVPAKQEAFSAKRVRDRSEAIVWIGASAGGLLSDADRLAGGAQLTVGLVWPTGFGGQARFLAETASVQRSEGEEIERRAGLGSLSVTYSKELSPVTLRANLGAGLSVSRVAALGLPESSAPLRWHPLLSAGAQIQLAVSAHWSLLMTLDADGFLAWDDYLIAPYGVVATSPRSSIFAGLGVVWQTKR